MGANGIESSNIEHAEAIYEHGLLRPVGPVHLNELYRVRLSISRSEEDPLADLLDHEFIVYASGLSREDGSDPFDGRCAPTSIEDQGIDG